MHIILFQLLIVNYPFAILGFLDKKITTAAVASRIKMIIAAVVSAPVPEIYNVYPFQHNKNHIIGEFGQVCTVQSL